jgi:tetratricopeptide (TPR) repeat protein
MTDARALLKRAQEHHSAGQIEEALRVVRDAIRTDPAFVDAWTYLGTTLITKRLAFKEGLDALEHAVDLAPDDAGVAYSLGWCYEFVAYRLEKQATAPYRDPFELYRLAAEQLRRCIDLNPEQGLREDAEDLLESIEPKIE